MNQTNLTLDKMRAAAAKIERLSIPELRVSPLVHDGEAYVLTSPLTGSKAVLVSARDAGRLCVFRDSVIYAHPDHAPVIIETVEG